MPRVIKKPQAISDLMDHFTVIARDKFRPALRFLKVAEDSFDRLAAMPTIGTKWESPLAHLQDVRFYPMPSGFRNYLVFYRETEDGIEVIAVLHGARDLEHVIEMLERKDPPQEPA
jgi:toxin ParE1/3/4